MLTCRNECSASQQPAVTAALLALAGGWHSQPSFEPGACISKQHRMLDLMLACNASCRLDGRGIGRDQVLSTET